MEIIHLGFNINFVLLYRILVEAVIRFYEPVLIVGKKANAVLISEDDWSAIQETLYLNSISGMAKSIFEGAKEALENCISEDMVEWQMYKIVFTKQALKDLDNLKRSGISSKAKALVDIIRENLYQMPPRYEKLVGDLDVIISRRINIQHRFVYQVYKESFVEDGT